jgi:DNA mismatch repair protein MutS
MAIPQMTPMIKQYLSIKEKYPNALLFYRMGDFYEMFFKDAEVASKELEITLTSRNKNDKKPVPMCGVPFRAAQGYIGRLVARGHKVAICDQVEDPALAKGLVKREVVRVITPGMIIENEFLDEKTNNFILSVLTRKEQIGLAFLDISTGTFRVTESPDLKAIIDETLRVSPREVIIPEGLKNEGSLSIIRQSLNHTATTFLEDRLFSYARSRQQLTEQFNTVTLEGYGCETLKAAVGAAGALMHYVQETQKQKVAHLTGIETYNLHSYLWVDDISCLNLEVVKNIRTGQKKGTLLGILDKAITPMGGRLLRHWLRYPLLATDPIADRHDAVEEAIKKPMEREQVRGILKSVYDLERLSSKITMGQCNARDLVALKQSLQKLPDIWAQLSEFESALLHPFDSNEGLSILAAQIETAIREDAPPTVHDGGMIKSGYHSQLDELIQISQDGKGWLVKLEAEEKEKTGLSSLKVRYNKVFGYYIEISKAQSKEVPANYVRKQTLVNAERYITDELKIFENKVLNAEEKRSALENKIFNELRAEVTQQNVDIQNVAKFIACLDCLFAFAEVSVQNGYCRPNLNKEGILDIQEGRHPVVEKMIAGERFIPNSVQLDNTDNQVLIITGPNMAGKSTVLRQVALLVIMAQAGSFVPADKANIPITDRIFTRVGALDNLSAGQSTFMVEMEETANILNNATSESLVIMDEIGRGTSTFDGLSIAWAVAEYLHDLDTVGVKTLFATHYHELTELARQKHRVKNYNIAVKEWNEEIIFLRKLIEGATNRSYGIQVARLAGIPDYVIKRSKTILYQIENEGHLASIALGDNRVHEPDSGPSKPVQIDLFQNLEKAIVDKLKTLDISRVTPLEALNILYELQQKTKLGHN